MTAIHISGQYMNATEVARIAGIKRYSVYSAIRRGRLAAIKIGSTMLVRPQDVTRWRQEVEAAR
jgi:excisionase family DNA binding protein